MRREPAAGTSCSNHRDRGLVREARGTGRSQVTCEQVKSVNELVVQVQAHNPGFQVTGL